MIRSEPRATLRSGDRGEIVLRKTTGGAIIAVELTRECPLGGLRDVWPIRPEHRESVAQFILDRDALASHRLSTSGAERARYGPIALASWKRASAADLALPALADAPLPATLYGFQQEGIQRLITSEGVILADDMGLGKSVQISCALATLGRYQLGIHALIVAPVTLLDNWMRELRAWSPLLCCQRARDLGERQHWRRTHVLLVSFEELADPWFRSTPIWDVAVVDEAHHLRNSDSQRARAFRAVPRARTWLATGTPIENRPADLAELLRVLAPSRFSASRLRSNHEAIRASSREFMLRRTKEAVLGELPQIEMNDVPVPLGPKQLAAYHMIETGRDGRTLHHLERIGQLRHVCDAFEGESAKLDWIAMRLQAIPSDEKVIVFSSHLDVLRLAQSRLRNCELLTGETEPDERSRVVRAFQSDDGPSLLLLSQRVGAEGITLTRANHVMFVNEWWNPSATAQAIDRIRRIGQHREMHCYRLFSPGTIEDRVRQLLSEKTAEAEEILGALRSTA